MSDEQLSSASINGATNENSSEIVLSNKDNQENENGYESECSSSSRSEEEIAYSALEVEADAFTRFIERQHMETMYELRRLRLGERPVTGQENRQRIATFFDRTETSSTRPVPPPPPSAQRDDIDALENRRCVSTILSSAAFRLDLENSIRRTIGTRTVAPPPPQPQPQRLPQPPSQPLNLERQERELNAWQTITDLQREIIVVEISDLVHRQLVTSALESDFRRHLERNVLHRLERGAPIEQQQQQTQTQPVIATIQPIPPVQPARTNNTDMDALTARLDSMQQMLQMMFTMQMDMQRSLRQEVAGALANTQPSQTTQQVSMQAGHCTVCLTALADTVLYRCGHLCVCYTCGLQLQQTRTVYGVKCPICRAPVDDILRVYRSSRDGEE